MAFNPPLFDRSVVIVENDKQMSYTFHRWLMSLVKNIREAFSQLQEAVDAVAAAQAAADAANAAADTAIAAASDAATAAGAATTAADAAQGTADAIFLENNLVNSSCPGATITATDVGSSVTVAVTTHNRIYGDGTTVSVTGSSVTGLSYSTLYYIYYDQASRAGGAVTYVVTTDPSGASQTGDRHVIGSVTTPAAAGGPVDGSPVYPPGAGDIR